MKILYDDCIEAIKNNKCSECNDFYQCSVCDYVQQQYEKGRTDTIDECIDKFAEIMSNMYQICGRSCPVNCNWGTTTSCKDMCKKWLLEQLKEKK